MSISETAPASVKYNVTEFIVRVLHNNFERWTQHVETKHWTVDSLDGITSTDIQGNQIIIYTYIGEV